MNDRERRIKHKFIKIWEGESMVWKSVVKRRCTERLERCKECGLVRRIVIGNGVVEITPLMEEV